MVARVVLAMSGGVDSSVAAHLLIEDGFDVVGVFMRHAESQPICSLTSGSEDFDQTQLPVISTADHKQGCCSATDAEDARRVAGRLGIPFYALDLQENFDQIMDYFVDEYVSGRTPNPCVMCNNWLKFGKLFEYADSIGAKYVATGHYARLEAETGTREVNIRRGVDNDKDQSYVLFGVERRNLTRMLLPIGAFEKKRIREIAKSIGLNVALKKDSQEICFVAPGQHAKFVASRKGGKPTNGQIVTTDGKVVGEHAGIEGFTIGQRKGLGVAMGEPFFVTHIDGESMDVTIGRKEDLGRNELLANRLNWHADMPNEPFRCLAQIRYNSPAKPAQAAIESRDQLRIQFDEPCFGVAPGQAVVCFDGDRVLGGGWIS